MARMRRRSSARWLAVLATLVLGASLAPGSLATAAEPEPADSVVAWNRIATATLVAFPPAAGGAPPALQVNMAMVQGAVYDAVNSIDPRHQPYLLDTVFDPGASKVAAVATAAYEVLADVVSTVPVGIAFGNRAALLASLADAYGGSLAAIPDSQAKADGIAAGHAAAVAMLLARQGDGRFGASQWVPSDEVGHWKPLRNADGSPILDPTPWVGGVRPFVMTSSSQFRTDGPQDLRSGAWADDFNEVKKLGSLNSMDRTEEQTHIALFWQSNGGPTLLWNDVARDLVEDTSWGVDLDESVVLFGKLNLAGADAAINCWNDKYYWDFWRPAQAIHEAGADGNPRTDPDESWAPLLAAPYPEHPSGHLCLDGAHIEVLQKFFGTDKVEFGVTSSRFGGETRPFSRFSESIKEIIDARIWAGLHYRTADIQAQTLGRKVAHYMSKHYFQPLD